MASEAAESVEEALNEKGRNAEEISPEKVSPAEGPLGDVAGGVPVAAGEDGDGSASGTVVLLLVFGVVDDESVCSKTFSLPSCISGMPIWFE